MLPQTPLPHAPSAHTELKSGRSFPILPKKGTLEQALLTLGYLQGRKEICQATSS